MATILENFKKDIAYKSDFIKTPTGDLDTLEGLKNIQEALYRRLLTSKGTVVHRPDYGVGIKSFQNSINSKARQEQLALMIQEQFQRDPRVTKVESVSINYSNENPQRVEILVKVKLAGYGSTSLSFLPFDEET